MTISGTDQPPGLGYDDLPALMSLMIGDEKHSPAATPAQLALALEQRRPVADARQEARGALPVRRPSDWVRPRLSGRVGTTGGVMGNKLGDPMWRVGRSA